MITEEVGSTNPTRLLDALAAVVELRGWLDRTEQRLVTRSRQTGLSRAAIGAAWGGLSRQTAHNPPPPPAQADPSAPPAALSAP